MIRDVRDFQIRFMRMHNTCGLHTSTENQYCVAKRQPSVVRCPFVPAQSVRPHTCHLTADHDGAELASPAVGGLPPPSRPSIHDPAPPPRWPPPRPAQHRAPTPAAPHSSAAAGETAWKLRSTAPQIEPSRPKPHACGSQASATVRCSTAASSIVATDSAAAAAPRPCAPSHGCSR